MPNTHPTLGSLFTAIANAIRAKTGSSAGIVADDFPTAIAAIPSGGGSTLITKSITANGTYDAQDDNADGYSSVTVNVPSGDNLPSISAWSTGNTYRFSIKTNNGDELYKDGNGYHWGFLRKNGTNLSLNLSSANEWKVCVKFRFQSFSGGGGSLMMISNSSNVYYSPSLELSTDGRWLGVGFNASSGNQWTQWLSIDTGIVSFNTWYYAVVSWKNGKGGLFLYDGDGALIDSKFCDVGAWRNVSFTPVVGGAQTSSWWYIKEAEISMTDLYFKIDNTYVWGLPNSKTENMGNIT